MDENAQDSMPRAARQQQSGRGALGAMPESGHDEDAPDVMADQTTAHQYLGRETRKNWGFAEVKLLRGYNKSRVLHYGI
jgi:hypothetical protein